MSIKLLQVDMKNPPLKKNLLPARLKTGLAVCVFIGIVSLSVGLLTDTRRLWHGFLVSSLFVLFLSLGGVFFTAVQHVSKAGWSVNIRRIMESFSIGVPICCVLMGMVFALSGDSLYPWFDKALVAKDHLLQAKSAYLNRPFLFIRTALFFGIWIFFSQKLISLSLKQDQTGDPALTQKSIPWSIAFLALFTLSFSFFSFDALMSLEPHWFSTVFGVYVFAGLFQSFISALILLVIYLRKTGALNPALANENHLHDLGKFLLGCTVFWAYIAFSQYMLIWYANLPEETIYYHHRSHNDWRWVSLFLIVFKFIVPFLFLLPRWVKRNDTALALASVLILTAQYVDIYWMVYPQLDHEHIRFGFIEIGLLAGAIGLFLMSVFWFLSRHPLIPLKDPRGKESSSHIVTY